MMLLFILHFFSLPSLIKHGVLCVSMFEYTQTHLCLYTYVYMFSRYIKHVCVCIFYAIVPIFITE